MTESLGMNSVIAEVARQSAEWKRMTESLGLKSALVELERYCAALPTLEHSDACESHPVAEDQESATEGQICAIEMLAIIIEAELPSCFESNRSELAMGLALATMKFASSLMQATGAPDSSFFSALLLVLDSDSQQALPHDSTAPGPFH